jgi:hypothetical protein
VTNRKRLALGIEMTVDEAENSHNDHKGKYAGDGGGNNGVVGIVTGSSHGDVIDPRTGTKGYQDTDRYT